MLYCCELRSGIRDWNSTQQCDSTPHASHHGGENVREYFYALQVGMAEGDTVSVCLYT